MPTDSGRDMDVDLQYPLVALSKVIALPRGFSSLADLTLSLKT